MKNLNVKYLAGGPIENKKPVPIFDDLICEFLNDLSKEIKKDNRSKFYADVLSFAFYCRKSNILRIKEDYIHGKRRIGRGLAFHIAPSNVPVNFAFSYLFGLLSGNANVVRVSTKSFEQVDIICNAIKRLFKQEAYTFIKEQTAIIQYERNKDISDRMSELADVRIIWGGDNTINEIRKSPVNTRCQEIAFADRYSCGIISAQSIISSTDEEIERLAKQFYNDTYLMDQNACSTPHIIFWHGNDREILSNAQKRFWKAVYKNAEKYDLADIKVSDKYVMLCKYFMEMPDVQVDEFENLLYVISLQSIPDDITSLRGRFGLFFQHNISELEELVPYIGKMVQSCVYYGIDKAEITEMVINNHLLGIDRIVEIGNSLDIGVVWDGYDLPLEMSRIVGDT